MHIMNKKFSVLYDYLKIKNTEMKNFLFQFLNSIRFLYRENFQI